MPIPLTPRQFRRRLAVVLPAHAIAVLGCWILLDHLQPAGGCTVSQILTGDISGMVSDCTGPRAVIVMLHGIAAGLTSILLVVWPLRAFLRRIEAKERDTHESGHPQA